MRKFLKTVALLLLLASTLYICTIVRDKQTLGNNLIRLHVVAASDSEKDQAVKYKVRDAVLEVLEKSVPTEISKEQAKEIIQSQLTQLETVANEVLQKEGFSHHATVSLKREAFPVRYYDTFTLPSGVYDSLRVNIGSAEGQNWWCVVFPGLCLPAVSEEVHDVAAGAGFSDSLSNTLTGETGYELRFFILDLFGQIENFLYKD